MNLTIPNFSNSHVLVIGDVMLDRYWHGDTTRISPEAPVPVVHVKQNEERAGGAGNVALNITALGSKVALLGIVGDDKAAETLQSILEEKEVTCAFHKSSEHPTITKLRVIGRQQQLIRLDFEEPFNQQQVEKLLPHYQTELKKCQAVIISDYGKGIAHIMPKLIAYANKLGIPVLIDPKGIDFSIYRGATLLTPNLSEFEAIVGKCENENILAEKALKLTKKNKLKGILVTRGAQGMSLIQQGQEPIHVPTQAQEVFDVTGAGDTVIATLGAALASGADFVDATQLANLAAGVAVGKLGTVAISTAELRRAAKRNQESWLGVISEKKLLEEAQDAKEHGETIVMTNGCFDILHAGHIAYLEQAKALGARLIIAVNDDDSVARLKGPTRPINNLAERMTVLAGLRAVDWVVAFSEDTPERLITAVTPNILVKGGDYKVHEIAGAEHVLAEGGEVKILQFVDGKSTTRMIQKLKEE